MGFGFSQRPNHVHLDKSHKQRRYTFGSHVNTCHVWAQQDDATRNGKASDGRIYFEGATIYSYGSHFPMARFTDATLNGQRVVLMTSKKYSVSTGSHMSYVSGALRGLPVNVLSVENVGTNGRYWNDEQVHAANIAALVYSFDAHCEALTNVRKSAWGVDEGYDNNGVCFGVENVETARVAAVRVPQTLTDYCDAFGLDIPTLDLDAKRKAIRDAFAAHNDPKRVAARLKAQGKRDAKFAHAMSLYHAWREGIAARPKADTLPGRSEARRDAERAEHLESYTRYSQPNRVTPEAWVNGQGSVNALMYDYALTGTLVRRKGDNLQTSRAAEVPFGHAVFAFLKAQHCRAHGKPWKRNGEQVRVGHFQLDAIDAAGGINAGCHRVEWDEMLRLAVREIPEQVKASYPLPALITS